MEKPGTAAPEMARIVCAAFAWVVCTGLAALSGWLVDADSRPERVIAFVIAIFLFPVYHGVAYLNAGRPTRSNLRTPVLIGLLFPVWFAIISFPIMVCTGAIGPCNVPDLSAGARSVTFILGTIVLVASTYSLTKSRAWVVPTLIASGWVSLLPIALSKSSGALPESSALWLPLWHGLYGGCVLTWSVVTALPRRRGFCANCGYDLGGNVSGICPECGRRKTNEPTELRSPRELSPDEFIESLVVRGPGDGPDSGQGKA